MASKPCAISKAKKGMMIPISKSQPFGDGWMVYEIGLNHREDSQNVHWWILQGLYHQFSGEIGDDLLITKFTSLPH